MPEPRTEPPHLEPKPWKNGKKGFLIQNNVISCVDNPVKSKNIFIVVAVTAAAAVVVVVVTGAAAVVIVVATDGSAAAVVDIDAVCPCL